MGYGASRARHRISLKEFDGSDNWVDIYAQRTSGAAARLASVSFVITGVNGDGTPVIRAAEDFLAQMRSQLFRDSIVEWSLKADDDDPSPMPLTVATFELLLGEQVGNWLDQTITAYYRDQALSEAAKRGVAVDMGGGAEAGRAAT